MLIKETVAVYCENRTEHRGNTLRLRYRAQPVNAVWGNSRFIVRTIRNTQTQSVWQNTEFWYVEAGGIQVYNKQLALKC
jgi:hypothetical protein